jgi:hypothetical protein
MVPETPPSKIVLDGDGIDSASDQLIATQLNRAQDRASLCCRAWSGDVGLEVGAVC